MKPDERFADDPVLARAAAARPSLDEADLAPTGERAEAILARVIASPRPSPSVRPRRSARWSRRGWRGPVGLGSLTLAGAVAALVLLFTAGHGVTTRPQPRPLPAADAVHLNSHPFIPRAQLKVMLRTPLGRAIAQQYRFIQENVDTGDAAQNRRAIQQLQFNQAACRHAAVVVAAAPVKPGQRFIRYDWVHGIRVQARMDALFIAALRAFAAGDRAAGRHAETVAGNLSNYSDLLTAYAMNEVGGDTGPRPHFPGIEGPGRSR